METAVATVVRGVRLLPGQAVQMAVAVAVLEDILVTVVMAVTAAMRHLLMEAQVLVAGLVAVAAGTILVVLITEVVAGAAA